MNKDFLNFLYVNIQQYVELVSNCYKILKTVLVFDFIKNRN